MAPKAATNRSFMMDHARYTTTCRGSANGRCPSDHNKCTPPTPPGEEDPEEEDPSCADSTTGKWGKAGRVSKCMRKVAKGKCWKKRVQKHCKKS